MFSRPTFARSLDRRDQVFFLDEIEEDSCLDAAFQWQLSAEEKVRDQTTRDEDCVLDIASSDKEDQEDTKQGVKFLYWRENVFAGYLVAIFKLFFSYY